MCRFRKKKKNMTEEQIKAYKKSVEENLKIFREGDAYTRYSDKYSSDREPSRYGDPYEP